MEGLKREDLYLLFLSFGLMYQCLKRAIPERKYKIKILPKGESCVYYYAFTEVCFNEISDWPHKCKGGTRVQIFSQNCNHEIISYLPIYDVYLKNIFACYL